MSRGWEFEGGGGPKSSMDIYFWPGILGLEGGGSRFGEC